MRRAPARADAHLLGKLRFGQNRPLFGLSVEIISRTPAAPLRAVMSLENFMMDVWRPYGATAPDEEAKARSQPDSSICPFP